MIEILSGGDLGSMVELFVGIAGFGSLFSSSSSSSSSSEKQAARQTQQGRLNLAASGKADLDVRGLTFEDLDADVATKAINASTETAEASQKTARELGTDAFALAAELQGQGLGFADTAMENSAKTRRQALSVSEQATENALSFASQATRSDASQALENVAKWGGLAALGVGLAFAFSGKG